MRQGSLVLLSAVGAIVLAATLGGCAFVGESEVRVESGNQPSGTLSRPMTITASSDEAVEKVAQRICDSVRPGSTAAVTFVGKIAGPGPIDVSDWGRYHYDCSAPVAPAARSPAPPPLAPPAPAVPVAATPAPAPRPAVPLSEAQEQHRRECQRKQGTYQICVGSCLASSSSASGVVEAECAQRCAAQSPVGCD